MLISLTIAERVILLNWKERNNVSLMQWLNLLTHHSNMEQFSATIKDKMKQCDETCMAAIYHLHKGELKPSAATECE